MRTILLLLLAASAHAAEPRVVRSARSGPWSASATWEGGKLPAAGEGVLIRKGHAVTYDVSSEEVIRAVNVAGSLKFAPDKDTLLTIGLLKIQAGDDYSEGGFDCEAHLGTPDLDETRPALEVGTPDEPIHAGKSARIRLAFVKGMDPLSCPALVCCGGRMDLHGTPLGRAWVKLGGSVKPGDTSVKLAEAVSGWRVGDRVIRHRHQRPREGE